MLIPNVAICCMRPPSLNVDLEYWIDCFVFEAVNVAVVLFVVAAVAKRMVRLYCWPG